jgi:hypothetical protein
LHISCQDLHFRCRRALAGAELIWNWKKRIENKGEKNSAWGRTAEEKIAPG